MYFRSYIHFLILLWIASGVWVASAQVIHEDYPGLRLEGVDDTALNQLVAHIDKCRRDSLTFRKLLRDVGSQTAGTEKVIRLRAYWRTASMLGHAGDLGELFIDLSDLQVLPDPRGITNGKAGKYLRPLFDLIPGTPGWATTVCGYLGHEIAELLEDVLDGKRDRPNHHYRIANTKEDSIVWDYWRVERKRGEDCGERHDAHYDILIELKPHGLERFHMSRDKVRRSTATAK